MKKIMVLSVCLVVTLITSAAVLAATYFHEDFDKGVVDGMIFPRGNWWLEDDVLKESSDGCCHQAFVENEIYSDLIAETDFLFECPNQSSAGFDLWYNSYRDHVEVLAAWNYEGIFVNEFVDTVAYQTYFRTGKYDCGVWYNLKVESRDGKIDLYLNDDFKGTAELENKQVEGPVGLLTGHNSNRVVYFDNFSIIPLPEPVLKEQCKNGGWSIFSYPVFKNQGECVSFIEKFVN